MQYRILGNTDIKVSTICLGGWSIVSEDFTWGHQEMADSIAAVHASLDAGVNFFDTAEAYGRGESEEILARALAGRRKDVVIASKVGSDHLADGLLQKSCEDSLRRLKTDTIDLYQIHWPSMTIPVHETLAILEKLKMQGKVRAIGVSNFGPSFMREALAAGRVEANQLPYSLLWRPIEQEIQPICAENSIGILCYSPLCQGLLTGKFASADEVPPTRARTRLFAGTREHCRHGLPGCEAEAFAAIAEIGGICKKLGLPMAHVALAWLLGQPAVTSVVAGARNAQQALQNAKAGDVKLPADVMARLAAATDAIKKAMGDSADMWQGKSRMEKAQ